MGFCKVSTLAAKIYVWEKWAGPVVDGHNDGISGSLSNCADFSLAHSGDCVAGLADWCFFRMLSRNITARRKKIKRFVIFSRLKEARIGKKLSQG